MTIWYDATDLITEPIELSRRGRACPCSITSARVGSSRKEVASLPMIGTEIDSTPSAVLEGVSKARAPM